MASQASEEVPKTANGAVMTADTAPVEKEPDTTSKLKTFLGILRRYGTFDLLQPTCSYHDQH
jgi:hypothetical protein